MNKKLINTLSWCATIMSIMMYVSYLPQIYNNIHGFPGSPIQPLVASVNSLLWVIYGLGREDKSYPVAIANIPGVIFGTITFITAI